jgi:thiol-disulfide isomerase/thioredoxin
MWLKKLCFIWLCAISMMSCAQSESLQLHDGDGRLIPMSELKNKWIVINYWADWCDSCIVEIPELNNFYLHNQNKNVLMFGVNYDQLPQNYLKQSMRRVGIEFPVMLEDPILLLKLGEVSVLPTTFIINPKGRVVRKIIGASTEDTLTTILNSYMLAKAS